MLIDGIGSFYSKPSNPRTPDWAVDFFGKAFEAKGLQVSSAAGLLLVKMERDSVERIFALTFGMGRFLLNDNAVEERFGLKLVLNTVKADSLRSIDKVSLGHTSKHSREQISQTGEASAFGIDIEQDLVNSVTGNSSDDIFGKTISGKDSFSASIKFNIENIQEFLGRCWDQYESKAYKENFAWIDQIRDVRNKSDIAKLDDLLLKSIGSEEFDRVWLVPPEIIDWTDIKGFRYRGTKTGQLFNDLSIQDLISQISKPDISKDVLTEAKIHLISSKTDSSTASWSAYKCVYAEFTIDDKLFILNAGKWYEVDQDFVSVVTKAFKDIRECELNFPNYGYEHKKEADYNRTLADSLPGSAFVDADNVVHGGGKSKVEICDVFSADKKLIHVKKYGGSAQLSHLFSQGLVSGTLLANDAEFRIKANLKLPVELRIPKPDTRPDVTKFEVVFAIISKSAKDLDIPFFSKVTLKNAKSALSSYGYTVTIKKVSSNVLDDGHLIEDV